MKNDAPEMRIKRWKMSSVGEDEALGLKKRSEHEALLSVELVGFGAPPGERALNLPIPCKRIIFSISYKAVAFGAGAVFRGASLCSL